METLYPAPRRARTPDPPAGWVAIDAAPASSPNPSIPHLPLPKARTAFAMARQGSDDHHDRRRESRLGFSGLSGLTHSNTLGYSSRRRRPEHIHQHQKSQPPSDEPQDKDPRRNHDGEHTHGSARQLPQDERKEHARAMHHKFASEGWMLEDDSGSKLGRRMSTLRGGNGISSWRTMRKHDNGSRYAYQPSYSHHTPSFASSAPSVAPSVAPSTSTASDAGSDSGHRTGSARHHTLSHVRNSTNSIHNDQSREASLTNSPQSAKSPLSPVTPRSPYGPSLGSPGKRNMSRTFRHPNIDEVLPFASSPFAAWDPIAIDAESSGKPAPSRADKDGAGWRDVLAKGATGVRRVWCDTKGKETRTMYKLGWERDVLDLESRLHETMYEVAGGRHSFVDGEPATVLDLGTGSGLWPVSAALQWRDAKIIGADLVPCHIDLQALAAAETRARSSVSGEADGLGVWASVASRVSFQQFNFLEDFPYDSGVFDMVHIRFVGLGVPETHWAELLDEAVRVLRPGGVLEIVEMSCEPPPSAPAAVANSFASQLLSDFIPQNPVLALQMHLPATAALAQGSTRPFFQMTWTAGQSDDDYFSPSPYGPRSPPPAIADAAPTWIRSCLSYRGTGLKALQGSGTGARAVQKLTALDPTRWGAVQPPSEEDTEPEAPRTPATGGRISLAAWVAVKM
ncbi:hypothetical protein CC85DRAFT_328857 [Cutaneotrichosporon oleaginosum]|uniref:Methyltransferase domain-containing protein n=1 Tax=Cutaneotrichosporon oleaginosum TaxID=879819 RepID=A0A0J0XKX6_9TREE|nr:uncharacterized protein CC85DRAFT_328857 [Cutaneotrichosporon oleaginosum]KLT41717.1 hypothetical protein CC85DRAFT_328857 [Cutaneotrichosporon oleaginosum]TXT08089.1 hypothetical protein COLE_05013 [Cutaneotrichosporon oleaginosum]